MIFIGCPEAMEAIRTAIVVAKHRHHAKLYICANLAQTALWRICIYSCNRMGVGSTLTGMLLAMPCSGAMPVVADTLTVG